MLVKESDFSESFVNRRWVVGAVNFDEDLHFSSYYIRASYSENTKGLYQGYNYLVGFYDNFTEKYYLTEEECISGSQGIIEKALANPAWLPDILKLIIKRTDMLNGVFNLELNQKFVAKLSNYELLSLYKLHDLMNKELYLVARLPEALDRSVNLFTKYLKKIITNTDIPSAEVEDIFLKLTYPSSPSILFQESLDFIKIVDMVETDPKLRATIVNNPKRARFNLPAVVVDQLGVHLNKWRYLDYHGYSTRRLASITEYIERLISILKDERLHGPTYRFEDNLKCRHEEKEKLFEQIGFAPPIKKLFEIFPDIGATKLYRRYGQLRNFYYLDMLLSEIGLRLNIDEHTLRYMLPEEIIGYLEEDKPVDPAIHDRKNGCCIIYDNGIETICAPKRYEVIKTTFDKKTRTPKNNKVLKGIIACKGKVVGSCKIMIRSDESEMLFSKGNILVSEATDPDLLKHLKIAGGVLTEQGGVTSHAAIICRELGIPTIIGIDGLLETLKDGDVVEIDANLGEVKLIPREISLPFDFLKVPDGNLEPHIVGHKASSLYHLKYLGYCVPEFVLFPFDGLRQLLASNEKQTYNVVRLHIQTELRLSETDLLAIRSSCISEDSDKSSLAGEFESLLNVPQCDLFEALQHFVDLNADRKSGYPYSGSVLIQKMIQPDFSGVCITSDLRITNEDALIIEVVKGLNIDVTGGKIRPARIVILKRSGDVIHELSHYEGDLYYNLLTTFAAKQFTNLARSFGSELDIEWAYKDGKLYFLQVRPIVFNKIEKAGTDI